MSYNPNSALVGEIRTYAGLTAPAGWLFSYGQALTRTSYPDLVAKICKTSVVTFSNSGGLLVNWTGSNLEPGAPISFTNSGGSLPTGISSGTTYYVKSPAANSFNLSTNVDLSDTISYTNSGTATTTAFYAPHGCGNGTTTFNLPDLRGRVAIFADNMGGSYASRITPTRSGGPTGGMRAVIIGGTGGEEGHTLAVAEIGNTQPVDAAGGDNSYDSNSGAASAHNNVQPGIILNAIIYTGV